MINPRNKKLIPFAAITFLIIFLMNYVGSDQTDRLYRAFLTAVAGVIGLFAGMWLLYRNKDDKDNPPDFD